MWAPSSILPALLICREHVAAAETDGSLTITSLGGGRGFCSFSRGVTSQVRKAVGFGGRSENEWMLLTVPVHPKRKT